MSDVLQNGDPKMLSVTFAEVAEFEDKICSENCVQAPPRAGERADMNR